MVGCSEPVDDLGDGFTATYIDLPEYRNIYFREQGIFSDFSIQQVSFNDSLILARGYQEMEHNYDTTRWVYYCIDKKRYAADEFPMQMESSGLMRITDNTTLTNLRRALIGGTTIKWTDGQPY